MKTIVVFSHLRWNGAFQRPQHLMARLAKRWRVVFIEEPMARAERDALERIDVMAGVQVWRPHATGAASGFHDDHLAALRAMVTDAVQEQGLADYWLWFCTPMALPLASDLRPRGIVYDCMDDLAAFRHAPKQLPQREHALFKTADLVFTAGRSLYNARRSRHQDIHCFPNSVDAAQCRSAANEHPLVRDIAHPRLGYCGAVDERINLGLIDTVAKMRPDWQIVMAGPTAGIDPHALPRRANIHWLGEVHDGELPALMSGLDVCLLPFALTDATKAMNPPQALEAMAFGKPVISTSIRDVVEPYGHVVCVADTPQGFVTDCEVILARTPDEVAAHAKEMADIVARTSWDATALAMADLLMHADSGVIDATEFVVSQPGETGSVPLHLPDAALAMSMIAQGETDKRATAA